MEGTKEIIYEIGCSGFTYRSSDSDNEWFVFFDDLFREFSEQDEYVFLHKNI